MLPPALESLIQEDYRDWEGLGDVGNVQRNPLPCLKPEGLKLVEQEYQRVYRYCLPADATVIMTQISLLKARYYTQALHQDLLDRLAREDITDAKQYPAVYFLQACALWRNDPTRRYAPSSVAQLMEPMAPLMRPMLTRKKRIQALLSQSKQQRKQ